MEFIYSDGGRCKYFKGEAGDCVVRAICNATGKDYLEVYNQLNASCTYKQRSTGRKSSSRNGVFKADSKRFIESLGFKWIPTMKIGQGCKVHLKADELPKGVLIVKVSKHLTCVRDGVILDTHDCSRNGTRCVYGYYTKI